MMKSKFNTTFKLSFIQLIITAAVCILIARLTNLGNESGFFIGLSLGALHRIWRVYQLMRQDRMQDDGGKI